MPQDRVGAEQPEPVVVRARPARPMNGMKKKGRLDETKPGSGLGLSIVVELAGLYNGALTLGTAPIGGLRAELALPGG